MKSRKLGVAIIIFILTGLMLSSCDNATFWERRFLTYHSFNWSNPPTTDSRGIVLIDLPMDFRDIRSNARDIRRVAVFDSYFLVQSMSFWPSDLIFLDLSTPSGLRFRGRLLPTNNRGEFMVDITSRNYAIFVEGLFFELGRLGSTTLFIDIETNIRQPGLIVDFEFFNNLDVEIWS